VVATPYDAGMTHGHRGSSTHPSLAGREAEMGALADTVRRLIDLTVTCDVPAGEAEVIAGELRASADRLSQHVPSTPHARYLAAPSPAGSDPLTMHDSMPYDVVIGRYNPLALPLTLEAAPPGAVGRGRFTKPYGGGPGWVHGAVIAAAFDIVLTAANRLEGAAGPTIQLSIRYRRPTKLDEDCLLEAWVERRVGNRVVSKGRLRQADVVTVEAEGEFAVMDPEQIGR
jgi:acyl-coenzyme A thioesterase PaaI-like protein